MDCVYRKDNKCSITTVNKCIGEGCRFAKTAEEKEESERKVQERIDSLDDYNREYIKGKYYGKGRKGWF